MNRIIHCVDLKWPNVEPEETNTLLCERNIAVVLQQRLQMSCDIYIYIHLLYHFHVLHKLTEEL